MAASSALRIQASPDGVWTGIRDAQIVEGGGCLSRADPRPLGEPLRSRRTEDVEVAARQFERRLRRIDLGRRHDPHDWQTRSLPPDRQRSRESRVAQ